MKLARRVSPRLWIISALCLSVAGAVFSTALLNQHIHGTAEGGLLAAVCGGKGGGCDKVLASRWSVFPPGPASGEEDEQDETGGDAASSEHGGGSVPVALLGLFYFSILAVWFAAVGVPTLDRQRLHTAFMGLCGVSCLGSIGFMLIMKFAIGAWCISCLITHVMNFGLLGCFLLLRPFPDRPPSALAEEKGKEKGKKKKKDRGKQQPVKPPILPSGYPGLHATALALLLAACVCLAEWSTYRASAQGARAAAFALIIEDSLRDLDKQVANYFSQPQKTIEVREDDPIIPALPGQRQTIVYFTDMDCPYCAKFEKLLFEKIKPMYQGHLRIVFKHYPLHGACNPSTKTTMHRHACQTARALEAARLQGGVDMFWKVHEYLKTQRKNYARLNYTELAKRFELDPVRFVKDMKSEAVARRIREDCLLGKKLGVGSTPAVFLNSRPVNRLMRDLFGWWELVSESFRRSWKLIK